MIDMTPQEIAVTLSHIEIWKLISESEKNFTLILEDDVYFKYNFANEVDSIWDELYEKNKDFDILFLSYEYVKSVKNDESLNRNKVKVNRYLKVSGKLHDIFCQKKVLETFKAITCIWSC